ncbi:aminopeptidase [Thalassotalea insulae]|uniref:Aminopeptidase n=1 Tax=Thalassotalea insulae TaxID=2056778 RepID=A0ABQ6GUZ0_9GAMM|nr:aminopeptidase PepB [Thalassotalea insulae]GLX79014.1 aminopeptidase [Thalassotalea insulae]
MTQVASIVLTFEKQTNDWQQDKIIQIVGEVIYIYLAENDEYALRQIQMAARSIEKLGIEHAKLTGSHWQPESQWAFALGFTCVGKLCNLEFTGTSEEINRLNDKLAVFAWARDLTNHTPAQLPPQQLAQAAIDYIQAQAPAYISSTLICGDELAEQGWMGIHNVGKGSINPPCLLELDFNPTQDKEAPVKACLVGKGITFDSGGYSIKSSAGMFDMKADMGGAAVVAGALALAIRQGLQQRVKLILCCAENLISNNAYKLSDIITYKNGVTCEVANTDAEGRIVLADGLLLASQSQPEMVIDAATLTGAAVMATGGDYTALFALDQKLAKQAQLTAESVNEPLWQLPLAPWHQTKCPSVFADTANSRTQKGGGAGGASNAAGFLSRFVDNNGQGWLHFDLAAAYNGSANEMWAAGATGLGIATIAELIR